MKRLEYLPLGKELKAQTDIIKEAVSKIKNCSKSDLTYISNYSFYKYYCYIKKF